MTVAELIRELGRFPGTMPVYFEGDELAYEVTAVDTEEVFDDGDDTEGTEVVVLTTGFDVVDREVN